MRTSYVNIARWANPDAFLSAVRQPDFQQAADAMPLSSHPSRYQVIRG